MRNFALFLFFCLIALPAQAQLRVDVTRGSVEALPIAISDFYPENPEFKDLARDIPKIITSNLRGSGLFAPINQGDHKGDS